MRTMILILCWTTPVPMWVTVIGTIWYVYACIKWWVVVARYS